MAATSPRPDPPGLHLVSTERYPTWEEVYRQNVERLYRLMFSKVGNRADAEDLTAEVFVAALPRLRTTASIGEVKAYLLAVARTVLAEHWRRTLGRQITAIDPDSLAEAFSDGGPDWQPEPDDAIRRVLDALPERYRMILELRFLQAATVRDAASQMGVSVANAKVLQYRALRHASRLFDAERK